MHIPAGHNQHSLLWVWLFAVGWTFNVVEYILKRSGMEHWLLLSLSGASSLLWSWGVVHRASAACILGATALPAWSRLLLKHYVWKPERVLFMINKWQTNLGGSSHWFSSFVVYPWWIWPPRPGQAISLFRFITVRSPNLEIPGLAGAARDDDDELLDLAPLPLPLGVCLITYKYCNFHLNL